MRARARVEGGGARACVGGVSVHARACVGGCERARPCVRGWGGGGGVSVRVRARVGGFERARACACGWVRACASVRVWGGWV